MIRTFKRHRGVANNCVCHMDGSSQKGTWCGGLLVGFDIGLIRCFESSLRNAQ